MAVQVWIGEKPEHPNERRAIVALANGLERLDGLYLLLANFSVGGRTVECESVGTDKYGRMLGLCVADGRDVNAEMVRSGHAWAFVKYSKRYEAAEAEAKKEKVGVWKGDSEPAWVFRERHWHVAEVEAPKGCAIKGNISENGRIYHMPWSPWYGKIKIEPEKGKRWFCSEAEALAAGWRPVQAH